MLFDEMRWSMTRRYTLKRRAESQEATRQRIIEAAVALHEVFGVDAAISAIAERAEVERPTVYRHFPDQRSLLTACTSHYFSQHPTPALEPWRQIADPEARLRLALSEIYRYFSGSERMLAVAERDLANVPALHEVMEPYFSYWRQVHETLAEGWTEDEGATRRLRASIAHATAFSTWRSLAREQELAEDEVIALMVCLTRCSARSGV